RNVVFFNQEQLQKAYNQLENKFNEFLKKKNIDKQYREREREREQNSAEQQKLLSQIHQLDSLPTKSPQQQAELDSKKQKLKELEEKEKKLTKLLPLDTQITILEREIRELEGKSNKSEAEEALLVEKKKELEKLLK